MTHEEWMKKLAANPRFKEAKKTGRAYVIPGAQSAAAEPTVAADESRRD
jgi:hypothetical protein